MATTSDLSPLTQASFRDMNREFARLGMGLKTLNANLQGLAPLRAGALSPNGRTATRTLSKSFFPSSVVLPLKLTLDKAALFAELRQAAAMSPEGLATFKAVMNSLSETVPFATQQLTKLALTGAQAGVGRAELGRFVQDAAMLGTAFHLSTEQAGSALAGFRTAFRLTQEDAALLGDAYGTLASVTRTKAGDIFAFSGALGKSAAAYGLTGQQTGALGAALLQTGVDAQTAATAADAALTALGSLTLDSRQAHTARQALNDMGLSAESMAVAFQNNAQAGLTDFLRQVKASPDPMRALNAVFGDNAPVMAGLMQNLDGYGNALQAVASPTQYAGTTAAAFGVRMGDASTQWQLALNRLSNVASALGTSLLPVLTNIFQAVGPALTALTGFINAHQTLSTGIVGGATALFALSVAFGMLKSLCGPLPTLWNMGSAALGLLGSTGVAAAGALWAHGQAAAASGWAALKSGAAWLWQRGVMLAGAAATGIATTAQWGLNAAMAANPIGIAIVALTALAGGMVYLYNTCEPVRAAFDAVFGFIGEKLGGVWEKLRSVGSGLKTLGRWAGLVDEEPSAADPDVETRTQTGAAQPAPTAAPPLRTAMPPLAAVFGNAPPGMPPQTSLPSSLSGILPDTSGTAGMAAPLGTMPGMHAGGVNISIPISMQGMPDGDFGRRVAAALEARKNDIERLISDMVNDAVRLAYGS